MYTGDISNENYKSLGCTVPEIEKILAPYYKMSKIKVIEKLDNELKELGIELTEEQYSKLKEQRLKDLYLDMKQHLQGLEIKYNTALSARGSFPSNL